MTWRPRRWFARQWWSRWFGGDGTPTRPPVLAIASRPAVPVLSVRVRDQQLLTPADTTAPTLDARDATRDTLTAIDRTRALSVRSRRTEYRTADHSVPVLVITLGRLDPWRWTDASVRVVRVADASQRARLIDDVSTRAVRVASVPQP